MTPTLWKKLHRAARLEHNGRTDELIETIWEHMDAITSPYRMDMFARSAAFGPRHGYTWENQAAWQKWDDINNPIPF